MCCCVCALVGCSPCSGTPSCCADNVGTAACNPALCSSCLTGSDTCFYAGANIPVAGSATPICVVDACAPCLGNSTVATSATPPQCLPCCNPNIPPCSPKSCGATDSAPSTSGGNGPKGGGSGAGSAPPSSGGGGKSGS